MTIPPPLQANPPTMKRTVSSSSAVSHMDLQIKHHWNDAIAPSKLQARPVSPLPPVTVEGVRGSVDAVLYAASKLSQAQHDTHVDRVKSTLRVEALSVEQRIDLNTALTQQTPETRRKAIVEFIRQNDGVIRWAASLRALAEATVPN